MPAITYDDGKAYEKLTKQFPLRPIRNLEQNERAAQICDTLSGKIGALNKAESDYLEVLTHLIVKYESRWEKDLEAMTPRALIQYLMSENDLIQKDLISEFGSPSSVSKFLKGERRLSMEQAQKLSQRFKLNISALIDP